HPLFLFSSTIRSLPAQFISFSISSMKVLGRLIIIYKDFLVRIPFYGASQIISNIAQGTGHASTMAHLYRCNRIFSFSNRIDEIHVVRDVVSRYLTLGKQRGIRRIVLPPRNFYPSVSTKKLT